MRRVRYLGRRPRRRHRRARRIGSPQILKWTWPLCSVGSITALIGRRPFHFMVKHGSTSIPGMKLLVFSQTLPPANHPGGEIVADRPESLVSKLRAWSIPCHEFRLVAHVK